MNPEDQKKYKPLENILQKINSKCISLPSNAVKQNNIILQKVLKSLVDKMKEKDPLFKLLYREYFYGGSYYDGLKISKPDEYDIDLLFVIPNSVNTTVEHPKLPGFVQMKMEIVNIVNLLEVLKMTRFLDNENFMSSNKVFQWMESILTQAINDLPRQSGKPYVEYVCEGQATYIYVKLCKGKPAMTLKVNYQSDPEMSVDLVGCFLFNEDQWPCENANYRKNPLTKQNTFFVVPKSPKNFKGPNIERYWRLSFQQQERELLRGDHFKALKPSMRLIKKLRDNQNHQIASYFIKTIYLWIINEKPKEFWSLQLGVIFMTMLKTYAEYIHNQNIPYYWNKNFNLLADLPTQYKIQLGNNLKNIIADIDRSLDNNDAVVIGKYLLPSDQFEEFKKEFQASQQLTPSSSVDVPDSVSSLPIYNLGFSQSDIEQLKESILQLERRKIQDNKQIMDQVENNKKVFESLERIEKKIDHMSNRLDAVNSDNEYIKSRLTMIEKSQRKSLGTDINSVLNVRQVKETPLQN